jgi:hypothetical protein
MPTSENVGSVSDTRLGTATEEIDQVSRLHRQGIAMRAWARSSTTAPDSQHSIANRSCSLK